MRPLLALLLSCSAIVATPAVAADNTPAPPPPPTTGSSSPPATGSPTQAPPAATSSGPASGKKSWARPQIEKVVAAGLMAPSIDVFRPNDRLTRGELAELLGALGGSWAVSGDPAAVVRVKELDAQLVRLLGVAATARSVRSTLAGAGLAPKGYAGTEVVARLLGLRLNHPQSEETLELRPLDPITRAETAYSVARVLALRASRSAQAVAGQAESLVLPELTEWQRKVLARATRFIGYPYIWGGTSDRPQSPFGVRVPGGFDCSGLVWRVYKTEPFEGAPQLAQVLQGRTTYVMSAEMRASERIRFASLQPGDLVFFGDEGPSSKPSQVGHMGIAIGGGWMIHSSSRGVTLAPMTGYYADRFAWGRRPLAEAGLA